MRRSLGIAALAALAALVLASAAGAEVRAAAPPASAPAADPAPAAAATPAAPNPITERAQALREAASLLDKASAARERGARSFGEQLFSSAELIVGPEALSELAPLFRQGAPPRVTAPLRMMSTSSEPQPPMVGNSDEEEPAPRPQKGTLTGSVTTDGHAPDGLAVVTLEPASGKWRRRAPRQRVMEQRGRQFAPRVLVVPVGSTVSFPNFDSVYHNVFSVSEAKAFDLGIYKNGAARDVTFEHEGVVTLGCNLHANMAAHIVVVSAPHYAVSDDKGHFAFKNLEPGAYKLRAWSERSLQPVTREVVVKADRNTLVMDLRSDAPRGPLPDKFGVARGGPGN